MKWRQAKRIKKGTNARGKKTTVKNMHMHGINEKSNRNQIKTRTHIELWDKERKKKNAEKIDWVNIMKKGKKSWTFFFFCISCAVLFSVLCRCSRFKIPHRKEISNVLSYYNIRSCINYRIVWVCLSFLYRSARTLAHTRPSVCDLAPRHTNCFSEFVIKFVAMYIVP